VLVVDIVCAIYFYVFPSLLAIHESHPHARAVAMINLLLGWTIVGWLVSLFWVLSSTSATKANPVRSRVRNKSGSAFGRSAVRSWPFDISSRRKGNAAYRIYGTNSLDGYKRDKENHDCGRPI